MLLLIPPCFARLLPNSALAWLLVSMQCNFPLAMFREARYCKYQLGPLSILADASFRQ